MPPKPSFVAIGLGSNLGDREAQLAVAVRDLTTVLSGVAVGGLYRSRAVVTAGSNSDRPRDYYNSAVVGHCHLDPEPLMAVLKFLEWRAGRRRGERWSARQLDLDLLIHGDVTSEAPALVLPHPALRERPFVLAPLADAAPGLRLPPDGLVVDQVLAGLGGRRELLRLSWRLLASPRSPKGPTT